MIDQVEEQVRKLSELGSKCHQLEDEKSKYVNRYDEKLEEFAAVSFESEKNLQKLQSVRIEFDSLMLKVSESNGQIEDLHRTKQINEDLISFAKYYTFRMVQGARETRHGTACHLVISSTITLNHTLYPINEWLWLYGEWTWAIRCKLIFIDAKNILPSQNLCPMFL